MTLMVTEKSSWSQGKALKKLCGDMSLTLMGKTQKSSRGYSSGFVPDDRHAVEAVGESEGFVSLGNNGQEDSLMLKRRCISLNADKANDFFVPVQVISLAKMTGSEKRSMEMRLRMELEQVQKFQAKLLSRTSMKSNEVLVSSSIDPLVKNLNRAGQNVPQLKYGISGRFESTKQGSSPSIIVLMKQCETLLKRLMSHQYAWVFNTPVDVVKLNIPDYFTVIKQPMDLGTVKAKLVSGAYSSPWDFASDVRLTFSNARTYNPPNNDVFVMTNCMSKYFEMRWKPIEKKLASTDILIKKETNVVKPTPKTSKMQIPVEDHVMVVLDNEPKMTDEEKLNLSRRLSLVPELPQQIIDFLKRHTDNANQDSEDEIEVDFDSLSVNVLCELKKMLDDCSKGNNLDHKEKTEPCKLESLVESGVNNSKYPCKDSVPVEVDEDLDICGHDPPITSYSPVDRGNNTVPRGNNGCSSSSSSSGSGSSSTDSGSTSRSESNMEVSRSPYSTKENIVVQGAARQEKGLKVGVDQAAWSAHHKAVSVTANVSQEGENAPSERQVSPDKLYRAALLRSRFADTILKAREKTLDQGEKRDPERLRQEREALEKQQREEKARLQAEAKAAEDARLKAEAEAATEAKRRREHEREAARLALLKMEKTVEINENSLFLKDLEMLRAAPSEHVPGSSIVTNLDCSDEAIDCFKLSGSNPLEQLGLFIKDDEDEEGEEDGPSIVPVNDVEEGEID